MDDGQFRQLLDDLGYAFEGYRRVRKGVKKRLRRHMRDIGCRDMSAYRERIAVSLDVREACLRRMAVPISRFMRDHPFWDALRDTWLPDLQRRFGSRLKAWSAGCACGEEAYSLAIIRRELRLRQAQTTDIAVTITATDIQPACLSKARAGNYPASSLREMPGHLIDRYFRPLRRGRRYQIKSDLSQDILWCCRRVECPLPKNAYHLIMLRNNILTYYEAARQTPVLEKVVGSLHPHGLLVAGYRERLPVDFPMMAPVADEFPYVYRKVSNH